MTEAHNRLSAESCDLATRLATDIANAFKYKAKQLGADVSVENLCDFHGYVQGTISDAITSAKYADLVRELHQASEEYDRGHGPLHAAAANAIQHLDTLLHSGAVAQSSQVTDDDFEALREVEEAWLVSELGRAIANLAYPVGCGAAPTDYHLKAAARALFDRYAKMVKLARTAAQPPAAPIDPVVYADIYACSHCDGKLTDHKPGCPVLRSSAATEVEWEMEGNGWVKIKPVNRAEPQTVGEIGWVASETSGPNADGYYTAGINILNTYGPRTHYNAIEFHSKDKATAEARRDLTLTLTRPHGGGK